MRNCLQSIFVYDPIKKLREIKKIRKGLNNLLGIKKGLGI